MLNIQPTDTSKVYRKGSWDDGDFDHAKSKRLLQSEIEICNPDLVILLGKSKHIFEIIENAEF